MTPNKECPEWAWMWGLKVGVCIVCSALTFSPGRPLVCKMCFRFRSRNSDDDWEAYKAFKALERG